MSRLGATLTEWRGLVRSLVLYHGNRARHRAMDALHRRFLAPGDLAFDIGAHVGDRTSSFRRIGARVVAVEPQPGPMRLLRLVHGRDRDVTLVEAAVGAAEGTIELHVNSANPTVTTASGAFLAAARDADGWREQRWDRTLSVPMTSLDALIARHGLPAFVKIDVEGFEDAVLAGLSQPLPALSFEFTTIARDVAGRCLDRLADLGRYRFNLSLGEEQRLAFAEPIVAGAMRDHLAALPQRANSGDVYATLAATRP
ncbi:FkbM family methyltransferase [Chelatococcus sp. XZ-Ab1]|uniref:FkbM family methyltransferase n=1 Tax=Chelatococcus sp. XZ-Ab1 TaxID=3034027 RepID=UPI0023E45CF9|nr:FkbM family methyltransferase [Chelatococcus sp. XZ-Ab1]